MALSRSRNVAAVVFIFALGVGSSALLGHEADAVVAVSTFTVVDGAVAFSHAGAVFTTAREGDVLAAGDIVRTGAGASAEITYVDGSSVRLEADAEIAVMSLPADGGVAQTLGRAWHVVTMLVSGSYRYEMRGPSSTASVRG